MRRWLRFLLALAREIGDENAYRRYLEGRGIAPSRSAWRAFSDERLRAKFSRAKCC
jgi:hypothetical protein